MRGIQHHRTTASVQAVDERTMDICSPTSGCAFMGRNERGCSSVVDGGMIHVLTWPASGLGRRGLFCSSPRYGNADRLDAVRAHGEPQRPGAYFPT